MKVTLDNRIFHMEGVLNKDNLYVEYFFIKLNYRNKKMSYIVWKYIQYKYKLDIYLIAFHTLLSYYTKMQFKILGKADDEGYYDLYLKYNIQK